VFVQIRKQCLWQCPSQKFDMCIYVHGNKDPDVNKVRNCNHHEYLGLKLLVILLIECVSKTWSVSVVNHRFWKYNSHGYETDTFERRL
jgi:hypothetical protein